MDQSIINHTPIKPILAQEDMLELVRQQQESDVSIRAFCERHQIAQSKFYYWRRKYYRLKEEKIDPGFALLQPQHNIPVGTPFCEIVTATGTCVRFYQPVPASTLQSLMHNSLS